MKGVVFAALGGGAGTLAALDSSGYGNHGTLTDMDPLTDWAFDPYLGQQKVLLDGSGNYIKIPMIRSIATYTVVAWVNWTCNVRYEFLLDCRTSGGVGWILHDTRHLLVSSGTRYVDGVATAFVPVNTWACLCITGISMTLTNSILVGAKHNLAPAEFMTAGLSSLLLFSRILSPAEITALADPSNVMLRCGGRDSILAPSRRLWVVGTGAPPAGSSRRRRLLCGVCG